MTQKVGFLFPAFGTGYAHAKGELCPGYREELAKLLPRASQVVDLDSAGFETPADGLQAHYVCYINSCVVSNVLRSRNIRPDYVAPYSMGLFAALFDASSVTFEDGLRLTHTVCSLALASVSHERCGMGVVIGLPYESVDKLISERFEDIEIADVTNDSVLIVSGKCSEIEELLRIVSEKGCLRAKMLPFSLPYHSKFMKGLASEIADNLTQIEIAPPSHAIVSCVNQKVLSTVPDIRKEVPANIGSNINWLLTMKKMLALGVNLFVECGASAALSKQARFIDGDFECHHPRTFDRLFAVSRFRNPTCIPEVGRQRLPGRNAVLPTCPAP